MRFTENGCGVRTLHENLYLHMFLRLQQSIHLKMQNNQHENATSCHLLSNERVFIPINPQTSADAQLNLYLGAADTRAAEHVRS